MLPVSSFFNKKINYKRASLNFSIAINYELKNFKCEFLPETRHKNKLTKLIVRNSPIFVNQFRTNTSTLAKMMFAFSSNVDNNQRNNVYLLYCLLRSVNN